jgi:hypothetical protein
MMEWGFISIMILGIKIKYLKNHGKIQFIRDFYKYYKSSTEFPKCTK